MDTAQVLQADIPVLIGGRFAWLHLLSDVLWQDASYNSTMVATLEKAGDFGPFTDSEVFIPYYRSMRPFVELPDGGLLHPMPLIFDSTLGKKPMAVSASGTPPSTGTSWDYPELDNITRPESNTTLAFMTVLELGALIRTGQISSVELTNVFQQRLKTYDPYLECTITFTDELAMQQAQQADALLAQGTYLGPLHGIPYGLKDLMAVPGYKTTWGAVPYKDQTINHESNVYMRLKEAGAVLIAKLTSGEMAYYDVWFDGFTKNPWNLLEGSSGSSAGPGSATAAGLVPFSVGTETGGSITFPADTNGVSALRPSFGLVGRSWIMSLAESLDKVGPFARSAQDVAVVLDVIRGPDLNEMDPSAFAAELDDPFKVDPANLTVGFLGDVPSSVVQALAAVGIQTVEVTLNFTAPADAAYNIILGAEAAAHFDYWQRSGLDDLNRRQDLWPPSLRIARAIPAVEYVQANRVRGVLITQMNSFFAGNGIDVLLAPSVDYTSVGNLVGLPEAVIPVGFMPVSAGSPRQNPCTIGIYGLPYQDAKVLAIAMAFQSVTSFHLQQPPINQVEPFVLQTCLQYSKCDQYAFPNATVPNITL
eukprot:jgi/Astpho2/6024/fgenesh1_pm.00084_%23_11_t